MKISIKYSLLLFAFITNLEAMKDKSMAGSIAAAGAFIAYALIEVPDLKILNMYEQEIPGDQQEVT